MKEAKPPEAAKVWLRNGGASKATKSPKPLEAAKAWYRNGEASKATKSPAKHKNSLRLLIYLGKCSTI